MTNIQDRLSSFLDRWQFAFNSDSDLQKKNRKSDDFYLEASELYIFLLGNGCRVNTFCSALPRINTRGFKGYCTGFFRRVGWAIISHKLFDRISLFTAKSIPNESNHC